MHSRVLFIAVALAAVTMLAGCGGGTELPDVTERASAEAERLVGTWQLYSQVTPTLIDVACAYDSTDSIRIEIHEDGSLTVVEYCRGEVMCTSAGTWAWYGDHAEAVWDCCTAKATLHLRGSTLIVVANDGSPARIEMHMSQV